ncbi:unnamed protein product, partial [Mesorhabditis spiculigera]
MHAMWIATIIIGVLLLGCRAAIQNVRINSDASGLRSSPNLRRHARDAGRWMNDEQAAIIKALKENGTSVEVQKDTIMAWYRELPAEKREQLDEHYKNDCVEWIKKVATTEEIAELKVLHEEGNDKEILTRVADYKGRLDENTRKLVDAWAVSHKIRNFFKLLSHTNKPNAKALWFKKKDRKRRDLLEDFAFWLNAEQLEELKKEKAAGKSPEDLKKRVMEYFEQLPQEKQDEVKEQAKGKCKHYFMALSTEDEVKKIKKLKEARNVDEIKSIIEGVIDRQEGDKKTEATKYKQICSDIYEKQSSRKRKDIDALIEKHLSWLEEGQKDEIRTMKAAGKSNAEIKEKVMGYLQNLDSSKKEKTKQQITDDCYAWLKKAASQTEIDALHKMHETDHAGCKKTVRQYILRLPADEQENVNRNLPFCERIWYGDHDHSHHQHHGHHKMKRHHSKTGLHSHRYGQMTELQNPF